MSEVKPNIQGVLAVCVLAVCWAQIPEICLHRPEPFSAQPLEACVKCEVK